MRTIALGCVAVAAGVGGTVAQAQTQLNLSTYVNDPNKGATDLQKAVGNAVQRTCTQLAPQASTIVSQTTQLGDLFRRCNELVETARKRQSPSSTGVDVDRDTGQADSGLLANLQQVSGEEVAAQGSLSSQVPAGQFANISGRLNVLRFGAASASRGSRVASLDSRSSPLGDFASRDVHASLSNAPRGGGAASDATGATQVSNPWGWFLESNYGFGDHDQTTTEDAFDYDSFSATTGTDYNFGNAVIGFSIGYDEYNGDFDDAVVVSGGDVKVNGVSGSLFGAWFGEGGFSVNGIATYGQLESDLTRRVSYNPTSSAGSACAGLTSCGASRTLTGSPDGDFLAIGASLAYDINAGGWDISPSLTFSYREINIDSFVETDTSSQGGLALSYDEQTIESTRTILGVSLAYPISRSFGVLTPNFRAEWHHEFDTDPRNIRAKYAAESLIAGGTATNVFDCAISCFTLSTAELESDYGVVGAGVSAVFSQRLQGYLYYEALVGVSDVSANSIALGIRGQF
jgi:outer membrane autotransporter protein